MNYLLDVNEMSKRLAVMGFKRKEADDLIDELLHEQPEPIHEVRFNTAVFGYLRLKVALLGNEILKLERKLDGKDT